MIRSFRRVEAPRLRARLSNAALLHTKLRLHAVDNANVVNEDLLLQRGFARAGRLGRRSMTILLEGVARLTAFGEHHWLAPGDVIAVESRNAIQMRQAGARYASLALEWEPGFFGDPKRPVARSKIAARDLARARAAWQSVRDGAGDGEAVVAAVVDLGYAAGVCERRPAVDLREEAPPRAAEITEALDVVLSRLADQPMMADLGDRLGVSARQLNRLVREYNERYAFNARGWIDTRNRRRLLFGATFMTAPGATAAYVARVVGYRSPTAFARALRRAGLPAPSNVADEVARIGASTR